jgi:DNA-directed RNA polymerase sigma subunit (sigma70/sigma32)
LNGYEKKSLSQIGNIYNVTKERIRQIEKRAINKLKESSESTRLMSYLAA